MNFTKPTSFWIRPLALGLILFIIQGCTKDQPTPVNPSGSIKIVSVTPTSGLTDGQQTNFSVVVSYNLSSQKTGTLMIGFNNGSTTNGAVMLTGSNKIINSGSGQYTFSVSATVKNWATLSDFVVYVNVSEDPIPAGGWIPYASDKYILIPKQ